MIYIGVKKPHDDALNVKVAIIWLDAIVLVTLSLENPLKLMHTPNIKDIVIKAYRIISHN